MTELATRWARGAERSASTLRSPRVGIEGAVLLALWLVLAAVVTLNSWGVFTTDIKPEVYLAPGRMTGEYLSAWQSGPYLGSPSFNVGLAPVTAALAVPESLGLPPEATFKLWHLLLLTVGAWGARRLYRQLAGPQPDVRGVAGRVTAAVAYVANPYVVVAGSTLAILLPWAFLPWQTYALVRAIDEPRSWRWPALFALAFAAMSGANAGVVPLLQLLSLVAVVGVLLARRETGLRNAARVTARCAGLSLLLSLYWLVPAVFAAGAGSTVVANSETFDGIANPSSAAEVLRGLGLWPLYGGDDQGPWQPEFVSYLTNPLVVLASFALPVLAFLSARVSGGRLRGIAVALVAVTVPVMVGLHPLQHPTPFGRVLRWTFDNVPVAGAFRTTNKAGSVLVLGLALLVALGAGELSTRLSGRGSRTLVCGLGAAALVVSTAPAFTGKLYTSPFDVPAYWHDAAADLDQGPPDERVWFVPGEVLAQYRWTKDRPDDVSNSLLTRPALVRTIVPVTSAYGANFLAAVDGGLNEGSLPPGTLSAAARYLGVGDVLLRNDVVWENVAGGRPSLLQTEVNGDPGLAPVRNYGAPGENTVSSTTPPDSPLEAALPPLQHYSVRGAGPLVRAESLKGMLLVDGDGFALPALVAAGVTDGRSPFRYVGDLSRRDLRNLLGPGRRLFLTDTNRRRTANQGRLGDGQGPLLRAADDPQATRALFGSRDQTVLTVVGGSADASAVGGAFGPVAAAAPENAVDGDLRTSWQFGDFRNAPGQQLTIRFDAPRRLDTIALTQAQLGPTRIDKVVVRAGDVRSVVRLPDIGSAAANLGGVTAKRLDVTVRSIRGGGFNRVGLAEVSIPGVRLTRVARMPVRLAELARSLDPAGRAALAATPLDVVMSRALGGVTTDDDDEERVLARDFRLPDPRSFTARAVVRVAPQVPDGVLDRVLGRGGPVAAVSTSRALDSPAFRASQAVDGDPETAWVPDWGAVGQSITVSGPRRVVDHVDVAQLGLPGAPLRNWATRVSVELDGRFVRYAILRPGRTRVPLPRQAARQVTLRVLATHQSPSVEPVRFSEVGFGGARIHRVQPACAAVSTIDGRVLPMRPTQPLTGAGPTTWVGCGGLHLSGGDHALRPADGWVVDRMVLEDAAVTSRPARGGQVPHLTVRDLRGPAYDVRSGRAAGPFLLVLGEGYDPRWRATVDGRDAGAPIVVDGYSAGWVLDGSRPHRVHISYGPQRPADLALGVSTAALLLTCWLALRRRGRRDGVPLASEWAGAPAMLSGRGRSILLWSGAAVLSALLGGAWLGVVAAVLAVAHLTDRAPRPQTMIVASAALVAMAPVLFILGNAGDWGTISANLVVHHPWPHRSVELALLLLVVGVVQDGAPGARRSGTLRRDA